MNDAKSNRYDTGDRVSKIERYTLIQPLPVLIGEDHNERRDASCHHEHHTCAVHVEPKRQFERLKVRENELVISFFFK